MTTMTRSSTRIDPKKMPSLWSGVLWAFQRGNEGGGTSRTDLVWRTIKASLTEGKAMRRWMSVLYEMHTRGVVHDLPGEYLRAVRPYVHRGVDVSARVVQLIDHVDWLETAFKPQPFLTLVTGQPLVLADLPAPRGYEYMRLQLQRAPLHNPEGELLLTLTLRRAEDVQRNSQPVDAADHQAAGTVNAKARETQGGGVHRLRVALHVLGAAQRERQQQLAFGVVQRRALQLQAHVFVAARGRQVGQHQGLAGGELLEGGGLEGGFDPVDMVDQLHDTGSDVGAAVNVGTHGAQVFGRQVVDDLACLELVDD